MITPSGLERWILEKTGEDSTASSFDSSLASPQLSGMSDVAIAPHSIAYLATQDRDDDRTGDEQSPEDRRASLRALNDWGEVGRTWRRFSSPAPSMDPMHQILGVACAPTGGLVVLENVSLSPDEDRDPSQHRAAHLIFTELAPESP